MKLPIGEVELPEEVARAAPTARSIAGLRPENFEDASMVDDDLKRERGVTFEAEIDLVESLGSDLYAYFHVESEGVESDQLADLAEREPRRDRRGQPARGRGADRRPPRPDEQGQASRAGSALGRHREAAPLRPGERREPGAAGVGFRTGRSVRVTRAREQGGDRGEEVGAVGDRRARRRAWPGRRRWRRGSRCRARRRSGGRRR